VTLLENDRRRYLVVEQELEHARPVTATPASLWVLEARGPSSRADLVIAVTGDDEDNIPDLPDGRRRQVRPSSGIVSRVKQTPRNLDHFKELGIEPAVFGDRPDPAPESSTRCPSTGSCTLLDPRRRPASRSSS